MSEEITFSVVVPLYNKGPYIARTLNSILTQSFQNFEVIIVDDGSTDNGAAVVTGYTDSRIRLIRQENQGVSAARNRGISESENDFIALLDADDEWTMNHLETLANLIRRYPQCALFSTYFSIVDGNHKKRPEIHGIPRPPWDGMVKNYFKIVKNWESLFITSSSVAFRKGAILRVQGFPVGIRQYEDEVVWGKFALQYDIAFSWDGEVIYHAQKGSASSQLLPIREHPFVGYARKMIADGNLPPAIAKELEEYILSLHVRIACRNIRCAHVRYTLKNLKSAGWFLLKPLSIYMIVSSVLLLCIDTVRIRVNDTR